MDGSFGWMAVAATSFSKPAFSHQLIWAAVGRRLTERQDPGLEKAGHGGAVEASEESRQTYKRPNRIASFHRAEKACGLLPLSPPKAILKWERGLNYEPKRSLCLL